MKLTATDTLHISEVKADALRPGEAFEVSDDVGASLIKRGLASEAPAEAKAAAAPKNKAEKAPLNKAGA